MTGFRQRAWPRARHALYLAHRWLGIGGCLLFAMWFASGAVMMYVAYPELTDAERLAGLAPLRLEDAAVSPAEAIAALPGDVRGRPPRRIALEMRGGMAPEPAWRIVDADGGRHTVSARTGLVLGAVDAGQAEAIARAFSGHAGARWAETLERDQWTVPQGLDAWRPLHRIEVGDADGTELYVSQPHGEVVRDTTRVERFWNWLGSVPHWIYFTPLRADPPLWHGVVVWLSAAGIASAVSGIVIGLMRVRLRRRYRGGAITPHAGWMAWHHVAGLAGGCFVLTWIVSGWLSMNPNGWLQGGGIDAAARARYAGVDAASVPWPPLAMAIGEGDAAPREALLQGLDGRPVWLLRDARSRERVVSAAMDSAPAIDAATLLRAAARLFPEAAISDATLQTQADFHWQGHHRKRVLPVWRFRFDDPARTWVYVDPASGRLAGGSDRTTRRRRWLFDAAHSLDFPWLIAHRPAWDAVVGLLLASGAIVSVSGVVVGWRRLRRQWRRRSSYAQRGSAAATSGDSTPRRRHPS